MTQQDKQPEPLDERDLDEVDGGAVGQAPPIGQTIYQGYGYGYGYPPSVWPPVDPNTASGLPPLCKPGGPPPGY